MARHNPMPRRNLQYQIQIPTTTHSSRQQTSIILESPQGETNGLNSRYSSDLPMLDFRTGSNRSKFRHVLSS